MKRLVSSFLASGLLLLAACNTASPSVQTPQPSEPAPAVVGLLEVTITGINSGSPTSQSRWIDRSGREVSSQAITLQGSLPTLVSRVVQVQDSTINYLGQLQNTRYVTAMFQVTNTSSTRFDNMIFYAINDPARSIGGTAFTSILATDGTPITDAAVARSIRPTHGMVSSGFGSFVLTTNAHLHLLTPSEVGEVRTQLANAALPVNAEPLQYGFRAPNAAGGLGRVIGPVGSTNPIPVAFASLSFAFPRTVNRTASPDTLTMLFAVGNDTTNSLVQSLEEQLATPTIAGNAFTSATVTDPNVIEIRTLSGSTYTGAKTNNLCRVVTAGSMSNPLAFLPANASSCN